MQYSLSRFQSKSLSRWMAIFAAVVGSSLAPASRAQVIAPPFQDSFTELKGWTSVDVGDAADLGGSDTTIQDGEIIISGSGSRIGAEEDGLRYVYQTISGDFIAEVKVTVAPTFQAGAKAGLMIRSNLEPAANMAFVGVTRDNGTVFLSRSDGVPTIDTGSKQKVSPAWLRMERRGEWVKGYFSVDGKTWQDNVGAKGAPSAARVPFTDPVLLGMAVTPDNNTAIDIARFDDFTVGALPPGTGGFAVTVKVKDAPEPEEGEEAVVADGVYVRAVGAGGEDLGGGYVAGERAVVLHGLPAGPVKIRAVGAGYETVETDLVIQANAIAETAFDVTATTAAAPAGTITGTVKNRAGVVQSNVPVRAVSTGASVLGPVFVNGTSNSRGIYTLSVPPGVYSVIRLSDPRFVPVGETVVTGTTVEDGGRATVDFEVETLPSIALTSAAGFPWKIRLGEDVTVEEDHAAVDDPETGFIDYDVIEGKSPWGLLDPTPRIYGWVRLKFQLPEAIREFRGNDLRLYGFTFEDTDTAYWNGARIGGEGKHNEADVTDDTGFVSAWEKVRDYRVPASAVNWDGDNVIAFKGFVRNSTVENGGFSVKSPPLLTVIQTLTPATVKGDLTGDGQVKVADATLALRIAVGLATPTQAQLQAGALGDGKKITVADVTRILRAAVGLITL